MEKHVIRKLLIANRGEIACRIIRTCRQMGIRTVAVYSDADRHALHVQAADEAIHIGPSPATESYLHIHNILEAAVQAEADSIHPGYGFLAENAEFAQAVIDRGLIFVGPSPAAIKAMGKKHEAKSLLKNVPLLPGYNSEDQSDDALLKAADEINYPVMVKASAGGGGKGMHIARSAEAMPDVLATARREAAQAFGDDTLLLEKLIEKPRHIEVQIFGDQQGNVIALGERECSIQRRHQKIIEETPSTALNPTLRKQISEAAVTIGKQLNYHNAGTVEFLLDEDGSFYFMEMNTRLQVEHPVTEMIYNQDLVMWQIRCAEGWSLGEIGPFPAYPFGHAIEARIYAEDTESGFLPATGPIITWQTDAISDIQAVRIDTGIRSGVEVTPHYDPMLAKVIAHGRSREEAIRKLDYALSRIVLLGVRNNISFLRRVINHPDHLAGHINTNFIEDHPQLLIKDETLPNAVLIAAGIAKTIQDTHSIQSSGFWRNNPYRAIRHTFTWDGSTHTIQLIPADSTSDQVYRVEIDEATHQVSLWAYENGRLTLETDGHIQTMQIAFDHAKIWIAAHDGNFALEWLTPLPLPDKTSATESSLRAPMPGKIVDVHVKLGDHVTKGETLVTLEAMKMEHRIQAPYDGQIEALHYEIGASVQADEILLELAASELQISD